MATKASKLQVIGRLQRVGYRRYVLDLAQEEGLAGYVKNENDGSVTIFVQGNETGLAKFVKKAVKPPAPALVKEMKRLLARPDPKLKHFAIRFGSVQEELQEGFGAMQTEFQDYRGDFKNFRSEFRDFRSDFGDYRSEFRDYRKEFRGFAVRTDDNFKGLDEKYGAISQKLTNILETLQRESVETRKELTRAVDNLARLVEQYGKREEGVS